MTLEIPDLRGEAIQPVGIRITKGDKTAFIALGPANHIAVVDATLRKVQNYLPVSQRVRQLASTPDDNYLFATYGQSNDTSAIDVASLKVVETIQLGEQPWGVFVAEP